MAFRKISERVADVKPAHPHDQVDKPQPDTLAGHLARHRDAVEQPADPAVPNTVSRPDHATKR